MKRRSVLLVLILLIFSNVISGGIGYSLADCPPARVNLSCPDECAEIPDCNLECGDCILEPRKIDYDPEKISCTVEGDVVRCVVIEDQDCGELDVEQERRHGVSMGGGWDSGTTSSSAVAGMVLWKPKVMDQRKMYVPTTLAFTVSHDLEQFDPDPSMEWPDYAAGIQEGPDVFPLTCRGCWDPTRR